MSFIDEAEFKIKAGKGGTGVVRWLHEYAKEFGGPVGGDGGRGGDVYVRAVHDTFYMRKYANTKEFESDAGNSGEGMSKQGKSAEDYIIDLPVGSVITRIKDINIHDDFTIANSHIRLDEIGQIVRILKGGQGGYGNQHFKASTNIKPEEFTDGKPGEEAVFKVEVEMIADIGFIGLPNAGKSSLLNALTKADVKVGNYAFTTLEPNLGALHDGVIIADIPGLIEGASEGKGLGHKFLRHIKRTKILLHLISLENDKDEMLNSYNIIRKELLNYDNDFNNKKEIILLTKTDSQSIDDVKIKKEYFIEKLKLKDGSIRTISSFDLDELKYLREFLIKIV